MSLFDRVIMNPPFASQQDIDHVRCAWNRLDPGGRLVSVMSAGVRFRSNRKTVEFRELVAEYGRFEDVPDGTFKGSETDVRTCLCVLDRP